MEALPAAIQREILAFAAAPELVPSACPCVRTQDDSIGTEFAKTPTVPSLAALQTLAQVCSTWRKLITDVIVQYERRVLRLVVVGGDGPQQQRHWLGQLRETGGDVVDLRVAVVCQEQQLWWDLEAREADVPPVTALDLMHGFDWENILSQCPSVERLDLSDVPLHYIALGDILEAAGACCPNIQALVLPKRDRVHSERVDALIDELFQKLYAAMRRWHSSSSTVRGLRQLTVPSRSMFDREDASNEFLATVLKFCPDVEFLDGWKRTYSDSRLVESEENLCVSREVWTAFCRSCSRLREFSWVVVPFSDEFFIPFGKSANPLLSRLQLTFNTKAPFRIRRNEYSTQGLCVLVRGCPALEHLDIVLHRLQSSDALIYPQLDEMIDSDVFNDDFITTLTDSCLALKSLRIREAGASSLPMNAITDRGLRALADARCLQLIDLQGAKCSADGILRFFASLQKPQAGSSRRAVVRLREVGANFGDVVQGVLQSLLADDFICSWSSPSHAGADDMAMSLSSRRGFVFRRSWLAQMRAGFERRFGDSLSFMMFEAERRRRDRILIKALRETMKSDLMRLGRLVLFTSSTALSARECDAAARRDSNAWVVEQDE